MTPLIGVLKNSQMQIIKEFSSFLDEKTGQSLVVNSDLNQLGEDLKRMAPEDNDVINEFINGCRATQGTFEAPKPGLIELLKNYNMSVANFAQRFKNPLLRCYITNMLIQEMPMYVMLMTFGLLADGQLGLVEGGSLNVSLAIAKRYQDLGGEITYGAYVQEIIVENNTAVGIRLADGTEHRADVIVSAADGYNTIFQMLGGKYVDQIIRDRYDEWQLCTPLHIISLGVDRQFPGEFPEKIVLLKEPFNTGGSNVNEFRLRIFNHDNSFAPEGKTVVQVAVYTDFDYWYNLQDNRALYEAEKAKLADNVIHRLEMIYPGISAQVEMTDVATPYTFWRYTRNRRGSWEGWLPTPETVRTMIPITLPGLSNFFMAGQWVLPAAGVPQVLSSGRNLVKTLCEQEGKDFSTVIQQ